MRKSTCYSLLLGLFLLAFLVLSISGFIEGNTNQLETPINTVANASPNVGVTDPNNPNGPPIYIAYQTDYNIGDNPNNPNVQGPDEADKDIQWYPFKMDNNFSAESLTDENNGYVMFNESMYFRDCKNACRDRPKCEGLVTDYPVGFGPGACYLKQDVRGGIPAQRDAGMFYRIGRNQNQPAPPDVAATGP